MSKQILHGKEAREKLVIGLNVVANSVKATLGPNGRNAVIGRKLFKTPLITKDGVSVAKSIELPNAFENQGAALCIEASSKSNEVAGDGTTTCCVLAQILVNEGIEVINNGKNAVKLKKGFEKAVKLLCSQIEIQSVPIESKEQIKFIATISGNDSSIGELVSKVFDEVGKDGVITVEEGNSFEDSYTLVEGIQFDKGMVNQAFMNVLDKGTCEFENPLIMLSDQKFTTPNQLVPILDKVAKVNKPLILICEEIDSDALMFLMMNKIKAGIPICVVKLPMFGLKQRNFCEDLAIVCGTTIFSDSTGIKPEEATLEDLGSCRRIIIDALKTTVIGSKIDFGAIMSRINQIRSQIANSDSKFEVSNLQERLAKLTGGIAVIKVGGILDSDIIERKHRIEDALSAVRAAMSEGIVPGGGICLLNARREFLDGLGTADIDEGVKIVLRACEGPLITICENAGFDGPSIMAQISKADLGTDYGFDALNEKYGNMLELGIIDPAKVVKSALRNAASIAGLILTTEVLIVDND